MIRNTRTAQPRTRTARTRGSGASSSMPAHGDGRTAEGAQRPSGKPSFRSARRSAARTAGGNAAATAAGARPRRKGGAPRVPRAEAAASAAPRGPRGNAAAPRSSLMRYASDNRVVQALYGATTGPFRFAFVAAVALIVAASLYFPLRDVYSAWRTGDILARQLAIRTDYNEGVQKDVDKLLSTEGIEDTARSELGLVTEGEQAIDVVGLDEAVEAEKDQGSDAQPDGASSSDGSTGTDAQDAGGAAANGDGPTTSAEIKATEQAVEDDAPWYIKMLDSIFLYTGVEGQKVASVGGDAGAAQGSADDS